MHFTVAEITTVKNDLAARANEVWEGKTFNILLAESNYAALARFYNSNASPTLNIWKPDLAVTSLPTAIIGSEFSTMSAQKQNTYFMLTQGTILDATNSTIRTSFVDIFGNNSTTKDNLIALAQRPATNFEKLFTANNVSTKYGYVVRNSDIEEISVYQI